MDPALSGAASKAVDSAARETGGLISRMLGPSFDVIGGWLADKAEFRLRNTERIFEAASRKTDADQPGEVPPRVAYQVLDGGSMADDELTAEYMGGVLAASRTPDGRDDRGVAWATFLNGMSTLEIRLHLLFYRAWDEALRPSDIDLWADTSRARLFTGGGVLLDLGSAGGVREADGLSHAMTGLARRGLIESPAWGDREWVSFKNHPFPYVVTALPTIAGLELYGWGLGHPGLDPNTFRDVDPPNFEGTLPRLSHFVIEDLFFSSQLDSPADVANVRIQT